MLELDIYLNPALVRALNGIITYIINKLKGNLCIHEIVPIEDPDLLVAWQQDLQSCLQSDFEQISLLLTDKRFGSEKIMLTITMAESILRASSALRLRIQSEYLSRIPERSLEEGKIDPACLTTQGQKAYACYLFLATLQNLIIIKLNPQLDNIE